MSEFEKNAQVSVLLEEGQVANTYLIDCVEEHSQTALLYHPRYPMILIRVPLTKLRGGIGSQTKGSEELTLDFCRKWTKVLGAEDIEELEALEMVMVLKRRLSKRMKLSISLMIGKIAIFRLNDNVEAALTLIQNNIHLLDSFNLMWYNNLLNFFDGSQPVTSKKQRTSFFNMAGFVMAQIIYPDQL